MFGWVDFREDKKKRRENGERKHFCECLAEGRAGKKTDGAWMFSYWANQNIFSPYWGKKLERTKMDKHGKTGQNL